MRSETFELLRFGGESGALRPGEPYILAAGSRPVRQVGYKISQYELLSLLDRLRYQTNADDRVAALHEVAGHLAGLLPEEAELTKRPLQLDLVMSAAELQVFPFEAALDAHGEPLFCQDGDRAIVLTRRIRGGFAGQAPVRKSKPRVLFAWASPAGAGEAVPAENHLEGLRRSLLPWIEPLSSLPEALPNESKVLTVLKNVRFEQLAATCERAAKQGSPYTHVHILAHGCKIDGRPWEELYGLAFQADVGEGLRAVKPAELARALGPIRNGCQIVTLAACDGGNMANTILPERSIAHSLHDAGFPVVIASQLPLTFRGSELLVTELYPRVLEGQDVRAALHAVRITLYQNADEAGHDWASLVAYVRLYEGYEDFLTTLRLERELAALRTAQVWSDHLTTHAIDNSKAFDQVESELGRRIAALVRSVPDSEKAGAGALEENLGLLGSAEKRLAELLFTRTKGDRLDRSVAIREALSRSHDWYDKASRQNLSHHWTGVQALSLEAVLSGSIGSAGRWHAALEAAILDSELPGDADDEETKKARIGAAIWARGSAAELYLLAGLAGLEERLEDARRTLEELVDLVTRFQPDDRFPIESTRRQLERYQTWWIPEHGFFAQGPDLASRAGELSSRL